MVGPFRLRLAAAALAVAAALAAMPAAARPYEAAPCADGESDPIALYGQEIRFRVLRNGTPVGWHRVSFERRGDLLVAQTLFEVQVDLLFITAYRYLYTATESWRDGCLVGLSVSIDDDGDRHTVEARTEGGVLSVSGPRGTITAPLGIFPTHHWNAGVLGARQVLNTITGNINAVRIVERGTAEVTAGDAPRPARHFAYTGQLQTEVWYDARGRWVKMRFAGEDGSTIEYVCEVCGVEQTARR